jgi:hypothetical protein
MSRHFAPISKADLAQKIAQARKAHPDNAYDLDQFEGQSDVEVALGISYDIRSLTTKIAKDLDKVGFDCENVLVEDYRIPDLCGLQTLDNGMTYLGAMCGGDWERPVYVIIYWNGVSLRGYIPKHGNTWNYDTKQALGNDTEADCNFLLKHFHMKNEKGSEGFMEDYQVVDVLGDRLFDFEQIKGDIKARIVKA